MQPRVAALFRAASPATPRKTVNQPSGETGASGQFWAYENWVAAGHRATVHRSECGFGNDGAGVHGGRRDPQRQAARAIPLT